MDQPTQDQTGQDPKDLRFPPIPEPAGVTLDFEEAKFVRQLIHNVSFDAEAAVEAAPVLERLIKKLPRLVTTPRRR